MSLTSYRTAPPRDGQRPETRPRRGSWPRLWEASRERADVGRSGGKVRGQGPGQGPGRRVAVLPASPGLGPLVSGLWPWTPRLTWRRPALPPLGGQYPGRGAVSRPSSEWGRVGPARCDHQVEPGVRARPAAAQRTDDRGQMTEGAGADSGSAHPLLATGVVKLSGMGPREQRTESRRSEAPGPCRAAPSPDICPLSSVLWSEAPSAPCALGAERRELWLRAIRTAQLHALPRLHLRPIDVVVDHGSR
jgi:hypothetical protein